MWNTKYSITTATFKQDLLIRSAQSKITDIQCLVNSFASSLLPVQYPHEFFVIPLLSNLISHNIAPSQFCSLFFVFSTMFFITLLYKKFLYSHNPFIKIPFPPLPQLHPCPWLSPKKSFPQQLTSIRCPLSLTFVHLSEWLPAYAKNGKSSTLSSPAAPHLYHFITHLQTSTSVAHSAETPLPLKTQTQALISNNSPLFSLTQLQPLETFLYFFFRFFGNRGWSFQHIKISSCSQSFIASAKKS